VVRHVTSSGITLIVSSTVNGRGGGVAEYKHDLVDKSRYQEQLEEELLFRAGTDQRNLIRS